MDFDNSANLAPLDKRWSVKLTVRDDDSDVKRELLLYPCDDVDNMLGGKMSTFDRTSKLCVSGAADGVEDIYATVESPVQYTKQCRLME